MLIEGTMGTLSKAALAALVLAAAVKLMVDRRPWSLVMRERAGAEGQGRFAGRLVRKAATDPTSQPFSRKPSFLFIAHALRRIKGSRDQTSGRNPPALPHKTVPFQAAACKE
jgi:hypothetical protein